jgi:hypothetical protein
MPIQFSVTCNDGDQGSGPDWRTEHLYLDTMNMTASISPTVSLIPGIFGSGRTGSKATLQAPAGFHDIRYSISDYAGNSISVTSHVESASIKEFPSIANMSPAMGTIGVARATPVTGSFYSNAGTSIDPTSFSAVLFWNNATNNLASSCVITRDQNGFTIDPTTLSGGGWPSGLIWGSVSVRNQQGFAASAYVAFVVLLNTTPVPIAITPPDPIGTTDYIYRTGDMYTFPITLTGPVNNLAGYGMSVVFDPTVLEAEVVYDGEAEFSAAHGWYVSQAQKDNVNGVVSWVRATLSPITLGAGVTRKIMSVAFYFKTAHPHTAMQPYPIIGQLALADSSFYLLTSK